MHSSILKRRIRRVIADPRLIFKRLKERFQAPDLKKRGPANVASRSLEDCLVELESSSHKRVLVLGDRACFERSRDVLKNADVSWASSDFNDVQRGSQSVVNVELLRFDAILTAGANVANDYQYVLRKLGRSETIPAILWASDRFEFCGGTTPIAAECDDADVMIFNHFQDFLGVAEPLLVRVEAFDQAHEVVKWMILQPRELLHFRLSDWLPERTGPACVFQHCTHPVLTRGRHYRWRSTINYHWKGSVSTVHGVHDFRGPDNWTEFKMNRAMIRDGSLVYSLPNYDANLIEEHRPYEVLNGRKITNAKRRADVRIDELKFTQTSDAIDFDEFFGAKFRGSGGVYWFSLDQERSANGQPNIAANHMAGSAIKIDYDELNPIEPARPFLKTLSDYGLIHDPHGLPVTSSDAPVEFGFEFDANIPQLRSFSMRLYDAAGQFQREAMYEKKVPGPVFADEVVDSLGWGELGPGVILVSPDWISAGADPRGRLSTGNLVARHRETGDYDVTEFQNCWRNVGVRVSDVPHWLSQDRMLSGRTNVLCGVSGADDSCVCVSAINGSGNSAYDITALVLLKLIAANGCELTTQVSLGPMQYKLVRLDDVMPDWRKHLDGGFGTMIVRSREADLNAHILTIWENRSVSLQHMWGY